MIKGLSSLSSFFFENCFQVLETKCQQKSQQRLNNLRATIDPVCFVMTSFSTIYLVSFNLNKRLINNQLAEQKEK